jgi:hypothetical protein
MKRITIYDVEAEIINRVCDDNNISEAELIEMLMEHIDEVKQDNDLK